MLLPNAQPGQSCPSRDVMLRYAEHEPDILCFPVASRRRSCGPKVYTGRQDGQTDPLSYSPSPSPLELATLPTMPEDGKECLVQVEL